MILVTCMFLIHAVLIKLSVNYTSHSMGAVWEGTFFT